jgi:hypothetical protein
MPTPPLIAQDFHDLIIFSHHPSSSTPVFAFRTQLAIMASPTILYCHATPLG